MSDRKKETEVIGEGNRISRYSESFVAFLVSAYSSSSIYSIISETLHFSKNLQYDEEVNQNRKKDKK